MRALSRVLTRFLASRSFSLRCALSKFAAGGAGVVSDGAVLARVLGHLLKNAAAATSAGQAITLRVTHGADDVTLSVYDTGKGFDDTDEKLFHR